MHGPSCTHSQQWNLHYRKVELVPYFGWSSTVYQGHENWPTLPSDEGTNDIWRGPHNTSGLPVQEDEVLSEGPQTVLLTHEQGIAVIRGIVLRVDAWCKKKTRVPALPYFNSSTQRLDIIHTTVLKESLGMCIRSRVKGRMRNPVLHSIEQSTRKQVNHHPCTDPLPDSSFQTCFCLSTNLF